MGESAVRVGCEGESKRERMKRECCEREGVSEIK